MASRPELQAPPEILYDDVEARMYTSFSRIIGIQAELSERALELLALPHDGIPRLLLDIGCGSGLSGNTISENGHQWIGPDSRYIAVHACGQWLCNADKSCHEPRWRLKALFGSLCRCLGRGARAVFQLYPENNAQRELILSFAMRAGFAGGVVIDYPHSSKKRKEYLVLTCGPPSMSTATPSAKGEDENSCSDNQSSGDEENQTVCISDRHRPGKKQKVTKKESHMTAMIIEYIKITFYGFIRAIFYYENVCFFDSKLNNSMPNKMCPFIAKTRALRSP